MSHVTRIKMKIKSLDALKAAVARFENLEWREGKKTHNWWGRFQGDYNDGTIRPDQMGKCDHAIALTGSPWLDHADRSQPYEVGVCAEPDGTWRLQLDFYSGGRGLCSVVGEKCQKLKHAYALEYAKEKLSTQIGAGWRVTEVPQEDGSVNLEVSESAGSIAAGWR